MYPMHPYEMVRPIKVSLVCNHSFITYATFVRAQTLVHTYTYCNHCRGLRLVLTVQVATETENA